MTRSSYPDLDIPNMPLYDALFGDLSMEDMTRTAIIDGTTGAETSYAVLLGGINALAGAFAARGTGIGDVVGMLIPNIPAFPIVFHGALRAGATATTLNSLYTADEIENQLRDSGASWLFTVSPLLPQAQIAADRIGLPADRLVVLDGAEGHPSLGDLLGEGHSAPEVSFDPATHLAVLPYSSGTTGRPKGVMLTHRNLIANAVQVAGPLPIDSEDRILAVLPFFHIYGMTLLVNYAFIRRTPIVTMPRFDLTEFLRITSEHRCTWLFVAPPIAVALAKHPLVDNYDLSSVKVVFSGAAPLDGTLAANVAARLGCVVAQGYGLTETSPAALILPPARTDIDRDTVGLLLPNTEARLVDPESGADIEQPAEGTSAPGELWIRGPQVMLGYLGNEEATANALTEDHWFKTGDIATVTSDGIWSIVDRLKELIKYKGYQVAPAVLEAVLLSSPDIADAAVVADHDEDGQEIPHAFVVRQPSSEISAEEVMAFVTERVAPHEKVRRVTFIEQIPKSSAGKILRRELRDQLTGA